MRRILIRIPRGVELNLLETACWLGAVFCGIATTAWAIQAHIAQHQAQSITPQLATQAAAGNSAAPGSSDRPGSSDTQSPRPGLPPDPSTSVLGRLEIARLSFSVPIVPGDDSASLVRGVGHLPGTAVPGGLGNFVLAGHRDTFFRPLRNIRPGMEIRVITQQGQWRYVVDRTEIVTPDRVDMLDIGNVPEMTLITCYPFYYVGAAPKRFIVHAHLLSVAPD